MSDRELIAALRRLKLQTGSLACLGRRAAHAEGIQRGGGVDMMGIMESAEVLRTYLDESAACVPPKVYKAISSAVVLMGAFGEALDVAVNAMVSARASAIAEASAHVEKRDER